MSLKRSRRRFWGGAEVKPANLHPCVKLQQQSIVFFPADADASRLSYQTWRSESPAQNALRAIGCEIPCIGNFASRRVEWNTGGIARRWRDHPPSPILVNDGHPLTSDIDQSSCAGALGKRASETQQAH
jgi:hypothetical protein